MFPDIAYLDWIAGRPAQAEYDLGSSDLRRATPHSGEVVPPALAETPTPERAAEEQLAEAYGVEPGNVLLTAGATHANFLAVAATISEAESKADSEAESGSEGTGTATRVLVEKPGYEPLVETPRGLGATVDRFRRPKAEGYPLDPDRVQAALIEDTALVTVTNRHNPSGWRVGRDVLAETARAASDGRARLLVDEVYAPFGEDPVADERAPFGGPTAAGLPNAVVTNSLTKFFGFGGVRLGWLVADAEFVARARSVARHVSAVADPSVRLARRALADAGRLAADSRERVRANRELLAEFVEGREDLSGRVHPGCTYAFLEHESADGNQVTEAAWDRGVLAVPGRFFGDDGRFRIGACRDTATVRAGLDRLGDVLDSLGT